MKYRIWQIKDIRKCPYAFRSWEEAKGFTMEDYAPVYGGVVETENHEEALEELFYVFNMEHPRDYHGRSMSGSDVVVLFDEDTPRRFYCDEFGWKEITFH